MQFVQVIDPHRIRMTIWERGAGYTLASGSSSCASAATMVRLGLCRSPVQVDMPGGSLEVGIDETFALTMLGPVRGLSQGVISDDLLLECSKSPVVVSPGVPALSSSERRDQ